MPLTLDEATLGREVWVARAGRATFRARIIRVHGDETTQYPWATLERLCPPGPRTQVWLAELEPIVGDGTDEATP